MCFENRGISPLGTIRRAEENMHEFCNANSEDQQDPTPIVPNQTRKQIWRPPSEGVLKLNCDGAFSEALLKGAIAVIVRDKDCDMRTGSARVLPCSSAIQAEAMAIIEALDLTLALGFRKAVIESVCLVVVNSCFGGPIPWQIHGVVCEIKRKIMQHGSVEIKWIRRDANKSADLVAKLALKGDLPVVWRWKTDRFATLLLQIDLPCWLVSLDLLLPV